MPRPKDSPTFSVVASGICVPSASKLRKLSLPEKHELLYEAARVSGFREVLESWTRKDLLQLWCLEMGKETKLTGLPKSKMVDHLLRLVSLNAGGKDDVDAADPLSFISQSPARRQRKGGNPSRLPAAASQVSNGLEEKKLSVSWLCINSACKAQLSAGDSFCKRCSCCICHRFDDNKDPSLWIVCNPEPLGADCECQLSCHIQCALDRKVAGVVSDGRVILLDGSYRCFCGKISNLIGCWKKQLLIAKDARRVDILCHRLALSHNLLNGTHLYKDIHEIVDKANRILACEVGSIAEGSAKLGRGIVSRLSSCTEVQKLIELALEKAETLPLGCKPRANNSIAREELVDAKCTIHFEHISSAYIVVVVEGGTHLVGQDLVGFKLWHRKASEPNYSKNPTCIIRRGERKALVSNLQACTEYVFRVVPFSERGDAGYCEARCFTKSIEVFRRAVELQPPLASLYKVANNASQGVSKGLNFQDEGALHNLDDLVTNFKVRDVGNVLQSAWVQEQQSAGVIEGLPQSPRLLDIDSRLLESEKRRDDDCKTCERVSPAMNVFLSPSAELSSVEDGACKPGQIGLDSGRSQNGGCMVRQVGSQDYYDTTGDLNSRAAVEERSTVQMGLVNNSGLKANSRKDCTGLFQENQVVQSPKGFVLGHAKVIELDDASDPGISHTAREENDASLDASGSVGANGTTEPNDAMVENVKSDDLESNGHGESWAVQVRSGGAAIQMEHEGGMVRKRTVGGLERAHNCYGLMNGCRGGATSTSICGAKSYEYCVRIIRWLECEGHLTEDFRMKFLTWFSLRATDHEKRVLSVFIDTFQDNPGSLAGQLVDTFEDVVSAKRQQVLPNGFCNRLWH